MMMLKLDPTEVVQIDIYQLHRVPEVEDDYKLDLEVEYTLQGVEEYTLCKRSHSVTYEELFDGSFLRRIFANSTEPQETGEIRNIPIRLHLFDRHNPRKEDSQ